MKTVWLLCLAWLLGGSVVTAAVNPDVPQDKKTEKQLKKEQKAQKKAAEEAEQRLLFEAAKLAIEKQDFVLEADRVEFKDGKSTVQLSFNGPAAGPNGLGGITVEGTATNIKTSTDKKGNINFSMTVQGIGISASVTIRLTKDTNQCSATVLPNFNSNRVSFTGNL